MGEQKGGCGDAGAAPEKGEAERGPRLPAGAEEGGGHLVAAGEEKAEKIQPDPLLGEGLQYRVPLTYYYNLNRAKWPGTEPGQQKKQQIFFRLTAFAGPTMAADIQF